MIYIYLYRYIIILLHGTYILFNRKMDDYYTIFRTVQRIQIFVASISQIMIWFIAAMVIVFYTFILNE